jgi:hypothetical protein
MKNNGLLAVDCEQADVRRNNYDVKPSGPSWHPEHFRVLASGVPETQQDDFPVAKHQVSGARCAVIKNVLIQ